MKEVIPPGSTIGVLGGGQLGRMFTVAATRMGYRVHVLSDEPDCPAGQLAQWERVAAYDDLDAVAEFARGVDVVTYEFENVPAAAAATAERFAPVRPGPGLLHVARNRVREKTTFRDLGIPVAPFRPVTTADELRTALAEIGTPAILKTCESGYDGKGQERITDADRADAAWESVGSNDCVLEGFVEFTREVSVVACRGADGSFANYDPIENVHVDGILDVSTSTGGAGDSATATRAAEIARTFAESLDIVGVFCIELFDTPGGLVVNEVAPRPHNSGHLTIEGHFVSQFEQQLRAVCGLPLGTTAARGPAVMANLIGRAWSGTVSASALATPGVAVHNYGKAEPRAGRKMGHVTATAETVELSRQRALAARRRLFGSDG